MAVQSRDLPANYPSPRGKQYPDSRRWPLHWPGPGAPPLGRTAVDRLSALLLGYAPRRLELITDAAFATLTGQPATVTSYMRLLPLWIATRCGVPSGGAFYPAELYVVWGGTAGLPAGVYHHDPVHHALELIRPGDPATGLDLLLGNTGPQPRHAVVVTCRVWKNAGKYGAIGYGLSMMDSGVLLGQLAGSPLASRVRLLRHPAPVDALLGLDGEMETAVAVVELPAADLGDATPPDLGDVAGCGDVTAPDLSVPGADPLPAGVLPAPVGLDGDRRNRPGAAAAAVALHQAIRSGADSVPLAAPESGWPAVPGREPAEGGPPQVELPPPAAPSRGATARRASATDLAPGLTVGQLAAICAYAGGHRPDGALAELTGHRHHPALWCLVTQVDGLAPGGYRYDRERHRLTPAAPATSPTAVGMLSGVNTAMSMAGASLFVVAEGQPPIDRLDPLALRDLYLRTGVTAQLAALAAATVGAATRPLGSFDTQAATEALRLPPGAVPLLQLLLGRPKPRAGALVVTLTEGSADA
ncbi:hypothetical protein ABZU22_26660 [Micromonospora sp. NPDC005222]|uniref:hypothetical protein n=2 Tax=unclassified Micromonospora TaxID=2617518 RepID=UPI0033AE1D85